LRKRYISHKVRDCLMDAGLSVQIVSTGSKKTVGQITVEMLTFEVFDALMFSGMFSSSWIVPFNA
jgi:hypothetical protein